MVEILFIRNDFKLADKGTWMAVPIRGALNADNKREGIPNIRHNHLAIRLSDVVIEAGWNKMKGKAEVFERTYMDWISDRDPDSFEVWDISDRMTVSEADALKFLRKFLSWPYDFGSVLGWQLIRQACAYLFGVKPWFGKTDVNKIIRLYCSNFVAIFFLYCTSIRVKCNPIAADPEDVKQPLIELYGSR